MIRGSMGIRLESAAGRSRIAGLSQFAEEPGPPIVRDSNRHTSRIEHHATYGKQRIGTTSTRHSCERSKIQLSLPSPK